VNLVAAEELHTWMFTMPIKRNAATVVWKSFLLKGNRGVLWPMTWTPRSSGKNMVFHVWGEKEALERGRIAWAFYHKDEGSKSWARTFDVSTGPCQELIRCLVTTKLQQPVQWNPTARKFLRLLGKQQTSRDYLPFVGLR